MIDKKKLCKRMVNENKQKEMPLLNLYIIIFSILVCIGNLLRIYWLECLKPIPIFMMIWYIHNKNRARGHLVPKLVEAGLFMSVIGDILLMPNQIESFMLGTVFFLIAHVCYVFAFSIGEQIRFISQSKLWLRRLLMIVILGGLANNVFLLFDVFPNRVLFPLYGAALSAMLIGALKRYERTTPYSFGFILAGSLLFVVSDNLLAFLKFNEIKSNFGRMIIMLTYYSAQFVIMHGSLHHSNLQHEITQYVKNSKKSHANIVIL